MSPDFYKGTLPKNLNINYKFLVQGFESTHYKYKTPVCVKPREYDPNGNFRRTHMLTGKAWMKLRKNKAYV
jgi:hypothetical protein